MTLDERLEVETPECFRGDLFLLVYRDQYEEVDVLHAQNVSLDRTLLREEFSNELARKDRAPVAYLHGANEKLYDHLVHYADIIEGYESVRRIVSVYGS